MSERLDEFLNRKEISADVLGEAARTLLSEDTQDLGPEDMRHQLADALGDDSLKAALRWLEQNPAATESAAVAWLAQSWDDDEERVRLAIEDASTAMPVLEIGSAAIAALYSTWLLVKRGNLPAGPLEPLAELFRTNGSS